MHKHVCFVGRTVVLLVLSLLCSIVNHVLCVFTPGQRTIMLEAANGDPGKDEKKR